MPELVKDVARACTGKSGLRARRTARRVARRTVRRENDADAEPNATA
jgi:hypothetical protein